MPSSKRSTVKTTPQKKTRSPKKKTPTKVQKKKITKKNTLVTTRKEEIQFIPGSQDQNGYQQADKILKLGSGWINVNLNMGLLKNIRQENNRVIFEFQLGSKMIDAYSVKMAKENTEKLKEGYMYVLSGTMQAQCLSKTKYDRSSNSNYRHKIFLAKIEVVEESTPNTLPIKNKEQSLKELNDLVKSVKTFTTKVCDVQIISGDLRRYMGCGICFTAISKPHSNGNFYCKKKTCGTSKIERSVCMIINMSLQDETGTVLKNAVCYHNQCGALFGGDEVVSTLCKASSDLVVRKKLDALIKAETVITATIKHQGPTGSQSRAFNFAKIIVEGITIERQLGKIENDTDDSVPFTNDENKPGLLQKGCAICPCEEDEDDEDFKPSFPSKASQDEDKSEAFRSSSGFTLDTCGTYELIPTATNHVGMAVILNMKFFPESSGLKERTGSDHNVESLKSLFSTLQIKVFKDKALVDINKEQFDREMRELKKELIRDGYSSLFFVLMSHGTLFNIRLSDTYPLNVYNDILPIFSEKYFPEFCGKPKIFILNACQYYEEKHAKSVMGMEVDDSIINPDVLLCISCPPGVKAKRNRSKGSYFIETLVQVFKQYWKETHLEGMMKIVQNYMRENPIGKSNKCYNIPDYIPKIFGYFYFKNLSTQTS